MAKYKFGDKVKTLEGKEGIVQEDQEDNSTEVKVMLEGDDFSHVIPESELEAAEGGI
ncbi:hypothetical protein [Pedobacter sp. SYSU D00535]|uniref:hypothetical protein n=1 Tax=Pedobacter sp. SYSU D00535 TaxID=2810308 RepID=UPI001A95D8B9|nr:hypothetical protein [Pedobacter sp. SYSU D00535]